MDRGLWGFWWRLSRSYPGDPGIPNVFSGPPGLSFLLPSWGSLVVGLLARPPGSLGLVLILLVLGLPRSTPLSLFPMSSFSLKASTQVLSLLEMALGFFLLGKFLFQVPSFSLQVSALLVEGGLELLQPLLSSLQVLLSGLDFVHPGLGFHEEGCETVVFLAELEDFGLGIFLAAFLLFCLAAR